ncbi:unnamed protein product [Allacma fusca]|uniref:Gustatory receptor n=1 Tax=Allacma fusca TaxID=39272 RepID=A0A8J2KXQ0_9HEXA|nr:unnamed protein product [Allacma fusca]
MERLFRRKRNPERVPPNPELDVVLTIESNGKCETAEDLVNGSHLLEYHKAFFDMGFFLLIVPFRLVRVKKNGRTIYAVQTHRCQKILCAIVQALIAYEYLSSIRQRLVSFSDIDGAAISYLNVATVFASFLYVLVFIYAFWMHAGLFKIMFETLQNLEFAKCTKQWCRFKIRVVSIGFCCFSTLVALTDPIIHDGLFTKKTFSGFLAHAACRASSYYLFHNCSTESDVGVALLENNRTILENLATTIHLLIYIPNLIMVHTVDAVVVLTALCMWHALTYFISYSKQDTVSAEEALLHYEDLKGLVKNMNAAVGILTFSAIAISLPFYASWGAIVFNNSAEKVHVDWLYLAHVSAYFVNSFTILHFGADFNFKIGEFYSRISAKEVCDKISSNRLTSIVMDMHSNQISMRACGFFVLTYRFFGTILSLIVTYSIIILQFQFSRQKFQSVNCTYLRSADFPFSQGTSP